MHIYKNEVHTISHGSEGKHTLHCPPHLISHLLRAQLAKDNGVHKPDEQTSSSSLSGLEGTWGG